MTIEEERLIDDIGNLLLTARSKGTCESFLSIVRRLARVEEAAQQVVDDILPSDLTDPAPSIEWLIDHELLLKLRAALDGKGAPS